MCCPGQIIESIKVNNGGVMTQEQDQVQDQGALDKIDFIRRREIQYLRKLARN